ncbi:hypothetical protein [Curvibacter gracilis]|uniref:hypothetical protein n=1 Tax=Curvibacter gracilis TaxID=230310 RepID=UPI0004B68E92|nr:hypothetical protein [Curvibacter gracilis]
MSLSPFPSWLSRLALALPLACTLGSALALPPTEAQDRERRYRSERQSCLDGSSHQDRATCLKEANAAHAQPVPAPTRSADAARYRHNQVRRCQALPERDHAREDCLSRMNEPSAAHGSVESGGILREWRRAEEAPLAPAR